MPPDLASQKGQLYSTGEYGDVHAMENILFYSTAVHTDEIEDGPIRWEKIASVSRQPVPFKRGCQPT
jgi:hypothetical protein